MTFEIDSRPTPWAVISDVHGNVEALDAVLAMLDSAGVRQIICCGDVVGYGASPNECVERLRERGIPTLLGNHDAAVLSDEQVAFFNEMARDAVLWTRSELKPENTQWLTERPMTMTRAGSLFVHASPRNPEQWNYVLTYPEARAAFRHFSHSVCFIGHSHQPFFMSLHNGDLAHLRTFEVTLQEGTRYLVNVGSVGQPRDRDPRAACVIVDQDKGKITLERITYDIAGAQERIRARGQHRELAERLALGH